MEQRRGMAAVDSDLHSPPSEGQGKDRSRSRQHWKTEDYGPIDGWIDIETEAAIMAHTT